MFVEAVPGQCHVGREVCHVDAPSDLMAPERFHMDIDSNRWHGQGRVPAGSRRAK